MKTAQCKCSFFCLLEGVDTQEHTKKSKASQLVSQQANAKNAELRKKVLDYLDVELKKYLSDKSYDLLANPPKSLMYAIDQDKDGL